MGGVFSSNIDDNTLIDDQLFHQQRDGRGHFQPNNTPCLKLTASLGVKGVSDTCATVTQVLQRGTGQQPKPQRATLLRSNLSDAPDSSDQIMAADSDDVLGVVSLGDINLETENSFTYIEVSRGTGQVQNIEQNSQSSLSEQSPQSPLPIASCGSDVPNGIQSNGWDERRQNIRGHQHQQQQTEVSTTPSRVSGAARRHLMSRDQMQIFVIDIRGKSHPISVNKNDKVDDLMEKIQNKTDVRVRQQALQYQDKPLQRGRFLTDYGIRKESTIYMTARLRGGY